MAAVVATPLSFIAIEACGSSAVVGTAAIALALSYLPPHMVYTRLLIKYGWEHDHDRPRGMGEYLVIRAALLGLGAGLLAAPAMLGLSQLLKAAAK